MHQTPQLIYDGSCGFCTTSAHWIRQQWPPSSGATIQPWQQLTEEELKEMGLSRADVERSVWWIDESQRCAGDQAIARALREARPPWRYVGTALTLAPLTWMGPTVYSWIARWRHRLPGSTAQCRLDAPTVARGVKGQKPPE